MGRASGSGDLDQPHSAIAASSAVVYSLAVPARSRHGPCYRFLRYVAFVWLFWVLVASLALNKVTDASTGLPLRVSLQQWHREPSTQYLYAHLHATVLHHWRELHRQGVSDWWQQIKLQAGVGTWDHAVAMLELDGSSAPRLTSTALRKQRNQLALKYHPDKEHADTAHMTPQEKSERFQHIQKAYVTLQTLLAERNDAPKAQKQAQQSESPFPQTAPARPRRRP
jgi:hypothetical protein